MRPENLQVIGSELAIRWSDGAESFLPLELMRRHCPCASCAGEKDIFGNVYKGHAKALTPAALQIQELLPVGGYAVQPVWRDGHNTGLYTFEQLRRLAAMNEAAS